jgi:type I restriction enzyme R subunit
MRDGLPNASFIGFTGTPIELTDKNTRAVFGDYISVYDIQRAVDDGATVPIYYESRLAKLSLSPDQRAVIDDEFEEVTEPRRSTRRERLKSQAGPPSRRSSATRSASADRRGHRPPLRAPHRGDRRQGDDRVHVAAHLRRDVRGPPRAAPGLARDEDDTGAIKVMMTGSAADEKDWQPHIRSRRPASTPWRSGSATTRRPAASLVIVRDMWLTGFDAPSLHTLYVDKPMQGHGLMQAIARVNRVFGDKPGGLVVDYLGLADNLRRALSNYTDNGGKGETAVDQNDAVAVMLEKLEVCRDFFHGFDYRNFLTGNRSSGPGPGAGRELRATARTTAAIVSSRPWSPSSRPSGCAAPKDAAILAVRDEVAFFQTVKAMDPSRPSPPAVARRRTSRRRSDSWCPRRSSPRASSMSSRSRGSRSRTSASSPRSSWTICVAPSTRTWRPSSSASSSTTSSRTRRRKNVVQAEAFSEKLERTITRYHNRAIATVQVIEELIALAKRDECRRPARRRTRPQRRRARVLRRAWHQRLRRPSPRRRAAETDRPRAHRDHSAARLRSTGRSRKPSERSSAPSSVASFASTAIRRTKPRPRSPPSSSKPSLSPRGGPGRTDRSSVRRSRSGTHGSRQLAA